MIELLFDAAALVGIVAMGYGLWLAWAPLGWIFAGVMLVGGTFLAARIRVAWQNDQAKRAARPVTVEGRDSGDEEDEEP